jgi:orotidine-5'-phosphate decarboxylase
VEPLGSLGLVVGATIGDTGHDLSKVNGPLLAPGLGAQGATPSGLREIFAESLRNVVPSYSREVLSAGPDVDGLQVAAQRVLDDCRAALG